LISILFELEAIPTILILKRFANFNKLVSSAVFPEFEIIIKTSFFPICPASPWETPVGSTKKLGTPTLEKVAAAFLHIKERMSSQKALGFISKKKITNLLVVSDKDINKKNKKLRGIIHIHFLLKEGVK